MINPLGARVLIKVMKVEEQTLASGLVLPSDPAAKDTHKAEVVATGPDVESLSVGDLVLITVYVGDDVEYEQEKFRVVDEEVVLAVIDR